MMLGIVAAFVIVTTGALLFAGTQVLRWLQSRDRVLIAALGIVACVLIMRWEPTWWLVSDLAVVLAALAVGIAIGSALRSGPALIAFCVVAGIVDVLSFSGGLTRRIVELYGAGESPMLVYLSITVRLGGSVRPIIGIGDLVVTTGLFTGFGQMGYRGWLPFTVPVLGTLLALGVGFVLGGAPALPFIGATTVVYVLLRSRQDRAAVTRE
jgi:hypothetical protein